VIVCNEYQIIRYVMVVALVKALAQNSPQNVKTAVTMSGTWTTCVRLQGRCFSAVPAWSDRWYSSFPKT